MWCGAALRIVVRPRSAWSEKVGTRSVISDFWISQFSAGSRRRHHPRVWNWNSDSRGESDVVVGATSTTRVRAQRFTKKVRKEAQDDRHLFTNFISASRHHLSSKANWIINILMVKYWHLNPLCMRIIIVVVSLPTIQRWFSNQMSTFKRTERSTS